MKSNYALALGVLVVVVLAISVLTSHRVKELDAHAEQRQGVSAEVLFLSLHARLKLLEKKAKYTPPTELTGLFDRLVEETTKSK